MTAGRRPRIAYVTYSTGEFDSRTWRLARSAQRAGYEVVVYARWRRGLPIETEQDGQRIVRVPLVPLLGVPGLRWLGRRRLWAALRRARVRGATPGRSRPGAAREAVAAPAGWRKRLGRWLLFPKRIIPWATGLDEVVEPADIWHGRLVGALPAVVRQKRRLGGAAVYDSGDVYLESRDQAGAGGLYRRVLALAERRWARRCDRIVTANEAYADMLARALGVPRPVAILNCSPRFTVPEPRPDRFREWLTLPTERRIVLYQGGLFTERGIEQAMEAILLVRDAALVLLGHGALRDELVRRSTEPPYRDRVFLLDAVPPSELLGWTASADAMVIAIQPGSLNHRHSTPNKLFEALAAGVPVVASDLPGMASIVRETGCGVLVDPTDPHAIADGLTRILDAPPEQRAAFRERCLAAARDRYNWESQEQTLLAVYEELLTVERRRSS